MTFVKIIKKSFYFLRFPMNHFDDTFWTSRTFFKNNFRNGILGYTRYVYVTHASYVRATVHNVVYVSSDPEGLENASFGPASLISTLPSRRPPRLSRCTIFALISAPATDLGTFPVHRHGFRSRYRTLAARFSSVTQMTKRRVRPSPGGFLLLSCYFFLHSVASSIGCDSVVILPVAPTMTTILCITWIERRRCCSRSILSSAIDRQIFKTSITQATKISYIIHSLLFYCYSFILESRLFCR